MLKRTAKHTALFLNALIVLMLLGSCTSHLTEDNEKINPNGDDNNTPGFIIPGSVYKTLVWALPGGFGPFRGEYADQWQLSVNEALRKKGADFDIVFMQIGSSFNGLYAPDQHNRWYNDMVIEAVLSGEQIDLAFIGGYYDPDWYMQGYNAGIIANLDDLLQTENGQYVYEIFPESAWDAMRINGGIYGLLTNYTVGYQYGFNVRTQWASENPVNTTILTGGLHDWAAMLPEGTYVSISQNITDITGMYDMLYIAPGVAVFNGEAISLFDSEIFYDHIQALETLYNLEYLYREDEKSGGDYEHIEDLYWGARNIPGVFSDYGNYDFISTTTAVAETVFSGLCLINNSLYKEESMLLLSWLHTDTEFADLLVYGIEGIHYEHNGGLIELVDKDDIYISMDTIYFTGMFHAVTPCMDYYLGVSERALVYMDQLESGPATGFHFDNRGWEGITSELNNIIQNALYPESSRSNLLSGSDAHWQTTLDIMNKELTDAGIYDLVIEADRQYQMWSGLYSPIR